jgi:hypothetical protein
MGQDHLACLPAVRVQSTPNCSRNAVTVSPMVGRKRGVDGSGQLVPLDLGPDRVLQLREDQADPTGVEVLVKVLQHVGACGVDVGGRPLLTSV